MRYLINGSSMVSFQEIVLINMKYASCFTRHIGGVLSTWEWFIFVLICSGEKSCYCSRGWLASPSAGPIFLLPQAHPAASEQPQR